MEVGPYEIALATQSLLDKLFAVLTDKGILTPQDHTRIFEGAKNDLLASEQGAHQRAANLLDHLYRNK